MPMTRSYRAYEFLQCEGFCAVCGHESQTLEEYQDHTTRGHEPPKHEPVDPFDVPGNE